ncbi:MAG: Gfo/Idh/MocA family protein, partial [Desulfomonilaceae bacterium]
AAADANAVFADPDVDCIVIATRHDTHARFTKAALESGKHVFVEKPLAISRAELKDIVDLYTERVASERQKVVTVGFNRRFAPHIQKIRELIQGYEEPKSFVMTVNAGRIPTDHWIQDPAVGGGRIIGEACHFIDLLRYLAQSPVTSVQADAMEQASPRSCPDTATFTLGFQDGSIGTIHYFANGDKTFPKERLEIFCADKILQMNNFQKLQGWGWPRFRKMNLWKQDKGHAHCVEAFTKAVREGGALPIPFAQLIEATEISFMVHEMLMDRVRSRIELPVKS